MFTQSWPWLCASSVGLGWQRGLRWSAWAGVLRLCTPAALSERRRTPGDGARSTPASWPGRWPWPLRCSPGRRDDSGREGRRRSGDRPAGSTLYSSCFWCGPHTATACNVPQFSSSETCNVEMHVITVIITVITIILKVVCISLYQ